MIFWLEPKLDYDSKRGKGEGRWIIHGVVPAFQMIAIVMKKSLEPGKQHLEKQCAQLFEDLHQVSGNKYRSIAWLHYHRTKTWIPSFLHLLRKEMSGNITFQGRETDRQSIISWTSMKFRRKLCPVSTIHKRNFLVWHVRKFSLLSCVSVIWHKGFGYCFFRHWPSKFGG